MRPEEGESCIFKHKQHTFTEQ